RLPQHRRASLRRLDVLRRELEPLAGGFELGAETGAGVLGSFGAFEQRQHALTKASVHWVVVDFLASHVVSFRKVRAGPMGGRMSPARGAATSSFGRNRRLDLVGGVERLRHAVLADERMS